MAKYTATAFHDNDVAGLLERYDQNPNLLEEANRSALIAAESSWRPLGSGFEGSTFTWNGHVIKTFNAEQSPFRNCFDSRLAGRLQHKSYEVETSVTRWPTEIPASLIAGTMQGFLPVSDAFFARSSSDEIAQWHLVTPLMQGGTLKILAKSVSESELDSDTTTQALDVRFRPRFDELLTALQQLHERGLCHDDIKTGNIFVATSDTEDDGAWLIGDLGNVRQVSHPYHFSALWTSRNRQLPDCRANDALRAIKAYLQFLRQASESSQGPVSNFDQALFENNKPWARLFWRAGEAGTGLSTGKLVQWASDEEHPTSEASSDSVMRSTATGTCGVSLLRSFLGWQRVCARASVAALKTSASEGWVRALALTWVFGVPVGKC